MRNQLNFKKTKNIKYKVLSISGETRPDFLLSDKCYYIRIVNNTSEDLYECAVELDNGWIAPLSALTDSGDTLNKGESFSIFWNSDTENIRRFSKNGEVYKDFMPNTITINAKDQKAVWRLKWNEEVPYDAKK